MFHIIDESTKFLYFNDFLAKIVVDQEFAHNPYGKYLVYVEEDNILGYIYYSDIYDRIEINQFEVSNFHKNKGIGSKLLNELIENSADNITLEVNCTNEIAIKLYKKYGFKEKAIRAGYYHGTDGILMEKKKDNESDTSETVL